MKFEIIEPRLADVEALAEFHIRCWQEGYRGILPDSVLDNQLLARRIEGWKNVVVDSSIFSRAARSKGNWLGFAHSGKSKITENEGQVYGLYVDQAVYRRGVGRALFESAKNEFAAHGYAKFVICVLRNNQRARAFYEAMGGVETDVVNNFVFEGVEYPQVVYTFVNLNQISDSSASLIDKSTAKGISSLSFGSTTRRSR